MAYTFRTTVQRPLSNAEIDANFQEVENTYNLTKIASDIATTSVNLYPDTATGLLNTVDQEYFSVLSADPAEYINLYQNVIGAAVLKKTYLIPESSDFVVKDISGNISINTAVLGIASGNASVTNVLTDSGDGQIKKSTQSEFRAAVTDNHYLSKTNPQIVDYTEVPNLSATTNLDVADGSIQVLTLSAISTITLTIASGQSLTLHINGGDTYAVTWPTVTWVGGSPPTLTSSDVVEFWRVDATTYAAYVGEV